MGAGLGSWDRGASVALFDLVAAAMPDEGVAEDDLTACLFDDPDPSVTLVADDRAGAVSGVVRNSGERRVAYVQLIAVHPEHRRVGVARRLLAGIEEWARDEGAGEIAVGAAAPFYLWPGVDFSATPALCLFEAIGYRPIGAELNMTCPTSFRAAPPDGVAVERVLEDAPAHEVVAFCAAAFPNWVPELERGIEHGAAFRAVASESAATIGFACHSVNRFGWIGPMGTDPSRRHAGVGAALLAALCADIRAAGRPQAEIAWVGPVGFYANAAGAIVSRAFRRLGKRLD